MHSRVAVVCLAVAARQRDPGPASILLFNGRGTSAGDVVAVEHILHDAGLDYAKANSRQLGAMTPTQLRSYHRLIVPGGDFVEIGTGLTLAA